MRDRIRLALVLGWAASSAMVPGLAYGADFTVTTVAADGAGSLRQAMLDANASEGTDTIAFAIPELECSAAGVCAIHLTTPPPVLTGPVFVDGTTQPRYGSAPANVCATAEAPSYMRVEIALSAGPYDAVFLLDQDAGQAPSTFRGLSIAGSNAIELRPAGAHRVYCNHLGVDGPGQDLMNFPNHGDGVLIQYAGRGVWIGTDGDGVDDVGERNVFGGWGLNVNLNANSENVIAGNYFGLAADGVTLLECNRGVYMRQSSYENRVGTDFDGVSDELERNVVARCSIGIDLSENSGGAPNDIAGNWIGVDATGAPAANQIGIALRYDGVDRIAYNRIEANGIGIAIDGGQPAQLAPDSIGNCFADNGTGFSHGGTAAIAFESNWWGAADGPSGLGPGTGDSVVVTGAGSVDFAPWETEACPAPEAASLGAAIAALTSLASLARAKRRSALRDLRVRARSARS